MTRKQRRLTMIGGALAVLAVAAALVLNAMRDSIVFFSTPSMAAEKQIPAGKRFRLGGLVEPGSLKRGDNLAVSFTVGDGGATRASCPTCSVKGRASSPRARSTPPAPSAPTPCSPSTTRPTCPRKSRTP